MLFGIVAAGGIGTLIAVILLLNSSLSTIAAKSNEMDLARGNDLVQVSVESALNRMTDMTTDNAQWDDAVTELYRPQPDPNWPTDTWGLVSLDSKPYDGSFVLDENYHILWGWFRGKPYAATDSAIFGTGFKGLVETHRQHMEGGTVVPSGLSRTIWGAAIVSIGLVRPTETAQPETGTMRRYLVMTRHLTPAMIGRMGQSFHLDQLRLTAVNDTSHPYLQLTGADKKVIAHLTWVPQLSGTATAQAAEPRLRQITWLIGCLVLLFVLISAYSLQKLARSEKDAQSFALCDGLSGLPNRRALFERLQACSKRRGRVQKTVVFIDLDGFKDINDIYGHNIGDKLIMITAAALKEYLPAGGMLARMGGDEFALLLGGRDGPERARAFAESALAFLTAPIRIGERTVQIGASIGIATGDLKACTSQELFRRADMAMYHSKANGKARITIYAAELEAARQRKQAIEKGIREGLARDEFDVVYQPIVDARTQLITSVEALCRWPGRPEGPLPPDQFIDIAEASGLIHQLGQFVLRRACTDLCPVPGLRLSANISPAQFRDPEFERKVSQILEETGFPVERLELEVTEGYLIENPDRAIAAVSNLKALGVSMALDDFGIGYSSIGYLRRFDFDRIKIDKSLAGRVDMDHQAAALVAGTVSIANALSIAVTAEGVETADHVRLLRLAGCHSLQGFYFSRPKPLAEVLDMVKAETQIQAAG